MNDEELTPHFDELKKVLEGKIDDKTLMEELRIFLDKYHLDIEETKRGIVRKYGGTNTGFVTAESVTKKIDQLNGTEQNVDILAKVVFAEKREIMSRGAQKQIVSGILGDETGTVPFTVWSGDAELEKGSVYKFKSCYSKKWNDRVQINIGSKGSIEKCEGTTIEVPERKIVVDPTEAKVGDIKDGMRSITVTAKILTIEERRVVIKGENRIVFSGLMADETGKIQFSAWKDFGLAGGDVINIKNGYTRSWKGIPQVNLGDNTEVSKVDDTFKGLNLEKTNNKTVAEIVRTGGGLDIEIAGTIVDIKSGSGIIRRCPICSRSVLNDTCVTHGQVETTPDLRMKLILDDGTGAISIILNRDLTEKLTGLTLENAMDIAKAKGPEYVVKELSEKILVKRITICGTVMSDDYGPKMNVSSAKYNEVNIKEEAQKLLRRVEAEL